MKRDLIKISIRVDRNSLEILNRLMGLNDNSKAIRASINFTINVAHNLFNGNISNMFKRKKENEEISLYDQSI